MPSSRASLACASPPRDRAAVHLLNGLYDASMDGQPGLAVTGLSFHDLIGTRTQPDVALDQLFVDMAKFNERIMGATHVEDVADLVCRAALAYRGVAPSRLPRGSAGSARAERPVEGKRRPSHLRHRGAERSSSRSSRSRRGLAGQHRRDPQKREMFRHRTS